eukprot:TRINITY_DN1446_c0_g1_i2.p1 TRINITY_DN1446_c0_g1~~TRINITY_DN1446_c0_g1_i2.p1  ORF type:complete len:196 (-),score=30.37 TRINITY_DN1446_c0_g1_i2:119-706(-)
MDEIIECTEGYTEIRNKHGFVAYERADSPIDKENILVKAEIDLGTKYKMADIVNVLINVEERASWDSSVREYLLDKRYDKSLLLKRYEIIVPMPLMNNREFVEKQLAFYSGGRFYVYSSSVDDSVEPQKWSLTRARTFVCGSRIEQEGKSVKITMVSQMDMKLFIPSFLLGGKMADEMKNFKDSLLKKVDSSLKS